MRYYQIVFRAILLGTPGIIALVLLLTPPAGIPRALLAVNPVIMLLAMALIGAWAAPKAGLKSFFVLGSPLNRSSLTRMALLGTLAGAILTLADHASSGIWRADGALAPQSLAEGAGWQQLILGVTYGGMTEEILMRFGLMSVLLLGLSKLLPRLTAAVVAIILSAALFAVGHLPALVAAQIPLEPALLIRILFLNGVLGAWFGWVFYSTDLESAIKAHAGFHFGAFLTGMLFF